MVVSQKPFGIIATPVGDSDTDPRDNTSPILTPQNKVADPVWGVQAPTGSPTGATPSEPPIPVTKGQ